jgi:RNA-directed DNA polymerase
LGGACRKPRKGSTRSKTLSMRGNPSHRNWEILPSPKGEHFLGALGKGERHKPGVGNDEKSDAPIVPVNDPNEGGGSTPPLAEGREGRGAAKGNSERSPAPRTQSRTSASTRLDAIRELARRSRKTRFTALMHHVTPELLTESFSQLKRSAAPGVDGVTWRDYEEGLDERIAVLGMRSNPAATARCHPVGSIFPNRTANSGRSPSPRWRTRSSSTP